MRVALVMLHTPAMTAAALALVTAPSPQAFRGRSLLECKRPSRSPRVICSSAKPFDEPGNYVSAYSSALGVSVAAVLCGELIRVPSTADALVPVVGRLAAASSLPLITSSLVCLRAAAVAGPTLLRQPSYMLLNLGVALASIAACTITPRPVLSVMVARGGTALLCLEIWSQATSAAKAGDPFRELSAAIRGTIGAVRRAIDLLCKGLMRASNGEVVDSIPPIIPACYAALALTHIGTALVATVAPSATAAALWPLASPGEGAMRIACSSSILTAVCATVLADVLARWPSSPGSADELRPFRSLNRGMMLSSFAHLALQMAAGCQLMRSSGALLQLGALGTTPFIAMGLAQLVHLATAVFCHAQDSLYTSYD